MFIHKIDFLKIMNISVCVDTGVSNSFSRGGEGHISLEVAFKGRTVVLGLYKCNYLTRGKELGAAAG